MNRQNRKRKQSRQWILVINNPDNHELNDDVIREKLETLKLDYAFYVKAVGGDGTLHYHVYLRRDTSALDFKTVKRRFPMAHIESARGSVEQNLDYFLKESSKYKDSKETVLHDTFTEIGTRPATREKAKDKWIQTIELIEEGYETAEIIRLIPSMLIRIKDIEAYRELFLANKFEKQNRNVNVIYIYGTTGVGKTRYAYDSYGKCNICRITSYRGASGGKVVFDAYKGEDVLVLDEYDSQIPIIEFLTILDIYPVKLPARYFDRTACFTKVIVLSNKPLSEQYKNIQAYFPEQWKALLRRFSHIYDMSEGGILTDITLNYKGSIAEQKEVAL